MSNIKRLKALLETDEDGEKIAELINKWLVDETRRNIFIMKLMEMEKELIKMEQEIRLTRTEEIVKDIVIRERKPLTIEEIMQKIDNKYKSLKYKTHLSATLNSLVKKGIIGKFRYERKVYFIDAKEAVVEAMKRRGENPYECSPNEIAEETGLPLNVVMDTIKNLLM